MKINGTGSTIPTGSVRRDPSTIPTREPTYFERPDWVTGYTDSSWLSAIGGLGIPFISGAANALASSTDKSNALALHKSEMQFNATEAQKNRDYLTKERLASQEFNVDMWNKSNEYNSPDAMIDRLVKAGINPNAAFGDSTNIAKSNPVTTAPAGGSSASYSSSLATNLLQHSATLRNLMASADKTSAEAANEKYELTFNKATESDRMKALQYAWKKDEAYIKDALASAGLKDVQAHEIEVALQWRAKLDEADWKIKNAELNNLRVQFYDILKDIELKDVEKALKGSQIKVNEQQAEYIVAQTGYVDEQTENMKIKNAIDEVTKAFSQASEIPIGTPQYMINFALWKTGQMESLYDYLAVQGEETLAKGNPVGAAGTLTQRLRQAGLGIERGVRKFFGLPYSRSADKPTTIFNW